MPFCAKFLETLIISNKRNCKLCDIDIGIVYRVQDWKPSIEDRFDFRGVDIDDVLASRDLRPRRTFELPIK